MTRRPPGQIRDAIVECLEAVQSRTATVEEIHQSIEAKLGKVAPSSVRSYLQINTPALFVREGRGKYRLKR